jgi:hypothetical protein
MAKGSAMIAAKKNLLNMNPPKKPVEASSYRK